MRRWLINVVWSVGFIWMLMGIAGFSIYAANIVGGVILQGVALAAVWLHIRRPRGKRGNSK
jgi:hypothetical protein